MRMARLESVDYGSEVPTRLGADRPRRSDLRAAAGRRHRHRRRARRASKRDIAKEDVEIDKIDKKLGNEQFVAKAKPEVIEEQHARRAGSRGAPRAPRCGAGACAELTDGRRRRQARTPAGQATGWTSSSSTAAAACKRLERGRGEPAARRCRRRASCSISGNSRAPEFKVWLREELGDVQRRHAHRCPRPAPLRRCSRTRRWWCCACRGPARRPRMSAGSCSASGSRRAGSSSPPSSTSPSSSASAQWQQSHHAPLSPADLVARLGLRAADRMEPLIERLGDHLDRHRGSADGRHAGRRCAPSSPSCAATSSASAA